MSLALDIGLFGKSVVTSRASQSSLEPQESHTQLGFTPGASTLMTPKKESILAPRVRASVNGNCGARLYYWTAQLKIYRWQVNLETTL